MSHRREAILLQEKTWQHALTCGDRLHIWTNVNHKSESLKSEMKDTSSSNYKERELHRFFPSCTVYENHAKSFTWRAGSGCPDVTLLNFIDWPIFE